MIKIKTAKEIDVMRVGGKILAQILKELKEAVKPGVTRRQVDELAFLLASKNKVKPSFKGYNNYPHSVCISVNDEVVHGLAGPNKFNEGDLVTLDLGIECGGFNTDSAVSFICGQHFDKKKEDLIKACEQSLYSGIDVIKAGGHIGDISARIQEVAEKNGYGVIRMLVGHGIGRDIHEEPQIPNFGDRGKGPLLKEGMTLAIEPMLIEDGTVDVILDEDNWTYRSYSGALTVHCEHTVLVTKNGFEILTV